MNLFKFGFGYGNQRFIPIEIKTISQFSML